jgi:hypothetical protein
MAHECPGCFSACYCGGDIDDMLMLDETGELDCRHCDDGAFLADELSDIPATSEVTSG